MSLQDLAGIAGFPGLEPAVGALFKFYEAVENVKVYKDQCKQLRSRCVELLLALRHNHETLFGSDYQQAVDDADLNIDRISRKVLTWSTWSGPKSLMHQSEIKQGLDEFYRSLDQCNTRLNILAQRENLLNQEQLKMAMDRHHAELEEKLQQLLAKTQDIHKIVAQPVTNIEDDMLSIQQAIHEDGASPETLHSLQQRLLKIHRHTELLPPMIDLTDEVRRIGEHPVNISGGYSDVYLGEWLGDERVALKLIRGLNQNPKAQKRFIKEMTIWRQLQHRNVARLYGVARWGDHIYAVSPWMEHRDSLAYITKNPRVDRLKLLCEVATGLEFLHKHGVVHGDLRGANILISEAEVACITDFGLSVIIEEESAGDPSSSTTDAPGNSRWMAPELINPELIGLHAVKPNTATDVWSYGMLCLEVLTGQRPFHNRPNAPAVISDLISGVRPTRPPVEVTLRGLSNGLWGLMQKCWHQNPRLRPAMSEILAGMKSFQIERADSHLSAKNASPRRSPKPLLESSIVYSNGYSSPTGQVHSPPGSSPIPVPSPPSNNILVPTESPASITPPGGSQTLYFPPPSRTSSSARPSTAGSSASSSSAYFKTSSRVKITGFTPVAPANLSHNPMSNHGKSVSLDAVPAQTQAKQHIKAVRPSTAGASGGTAPRLPGINEMHKDTGNEDFGDFLRYFQAADFLDPTDIPTVQLERASTPEPGLPSSLPKSFVVPEGHAPPSVLDVAPSEGSGNLSVRSDLSPTSSVSAEPPTRKPVYLKTRDDGTVEAGTLSGLVERLIVDSKDFRKDMHFREMFLTSYQAFTNAEELFTLLVERFNAVSSPEHNSEKRAGVRHSVLTVLDLWLRVHHWELKDVPLLHRMREFAISIQASLSVPAFRESAQRLTELINSTRDSIVSPVPPLTPSSSSSSLRSSIRPSEISPQDLALALTMLESDRYRKIIPSDFIGWLKGIHESNGVSSFMNENAKLSYWVQKSILRPDGQGQRAENLKYFLTVAEECRKLRNFSSTCALFSGIASPCITDLKRTSTVDKFGARIFRDAEKVMSSGSNKSFVEYRAALNASREPCVPWLTVHLRDVKTIHDSQRTLVKQAGYTSVINFNLYRLVHERIRLVLRYQENTYKFIDSDRQAEIQNFVNSQLRSLIVDPKWLQARAAKLAREEQADYVAHTQELAAAGFIKTTR